MKFARYSLSLALIMFTLTLPCVASATSSAAAAHKFHTSFAEAAYNARTRSLEVTLRTFPDDLENILGKRSGKRMSLDRKREVEPHIAGLLAGDFSVEDCEGQNGQTIVGRHGRRS
jgi:hypothetical protein